MPNNTLSLYTVNDLSSMSLTLTQAECEEFWLDIRRERSLVTGKTQNECHGRFAGYCRFQVEPGAFLVINWEAGRSVLDGESCRWSITDCEDNPGFVLEGAVLLDALEETWPEPLMKAILGRNEICAGIMGACMKVFCETPVEPQPLFEQRSQ